MGGDSRGRLGREVLDHATDVTAIVALAWLAGVSQEPLGTELIAAITTIALGQRYAKHKWQTVTSKE